MPQYRFCYLSRLKFCRRPRGTSSRAIYRMDRLSGVVLSGMYCFQEDLSLNILFRKFENLFLFSAPKRWWQFVKPQLNSSSFYRYSIEQTNALHQPRILIVSKTQRLLVSEPKNKVSILYRICIGFITD
jgi:hypothetical protein